MQRIWMWAPKLPASDGLFGALMRLASRIVGALTYPRTAEVILIVLTILFFIGAGHEVRNVSHSPMLRRYLGLALLCALLAALLHIAQAL